MAVQPHMHQLLGMPDEAKRRMQSKLQILQALELYRCTHGYTQQVAAVKFCDAYNAGELAVDNELRQQLPELSHKTVEKWRLVLKRDGIAGLAGKYGNRRGHNSIDAQPEVRDHIIGCLVKFPHARATRVLEFLQVRFDERGDIDLPSERSLQRWIEAWKHRNEQTYTALTNPDQWKGRFKAAFGDASEHIVRLNQLWELDATPADVLLKDGRHSLIGGIDVYTRRMSLLVTRTPRSAANNQLLRKMVLAFGKPESVKTDQGKDFVSAEFNTFLGAMQIEHAVSNKFSPWEKPHIERGLKTFLHDLVELLPGYAGHNVADAQALRSQQSFAERLFEKNAVVEIKMTAAELQTFCDKWCEHRYHHRQHAELGKSPLQMVAEWRNPIVRIDDERALDLLLLEVPTNKGVRVVQKKGIRLPEGWFIAPELEAHIGKAMHCRYLDAGRIVCYSIEDWQFICIAVEPDLAGHSRREIAAKTREIQTRRVQQERAQLRAIERSVTPQDAAAEILRDNAVASGKLVMLPRRAERTTTPALEAASQARTAIEAPRADSSSLMTSDEFAAARARAEAPVVQTPMFASPAARAFWLADQQYKRELSGEEQMYLEEFRRENPRAAREMDELMRLRHESAALKSV